MRRRVRRGGVASSLAVVYPSGIRSYEAFDLRLLPDIPVGGALRAVSAGTAKGSPKLMPYPRPLPWPDNGVPTICSRAPVCNGDAPARGEGPLWLKGVLTGCTDPCNRLLAPVWIREDLSGWPSPREGGPGPGGGLPWLAASP